jgi:hypothetical protein
MASVALLAAFDMSFAVELAEGRARGQYVAWTENMVEAGFHLPLALVGVYLLWEAIKIGWRWADQVAVSATPQGLVPHHSLLMKPIAWSDITDVRVDRSGPAPRLVISLTNGGSRAIRMIDDEGGGAESFAEAARQRAHGC